ncbi:MAG TPA: citramalate synthase, partial [Thermoleophilia bacterium]|nr:citramalate synthase [Thermoleophilia bacterium]
TWALHIEKVLKVDRDENLRMIDESIRFLRGEGKEVVYDAEHFFDAYAEHPEYALECLRAAAAAGAGTVVLCDTNGATLPAVLGEVVEAVNASIGDLADLGIHTHNDTSCAVANSLVAVEKGVVHVQGTINGYGERCGNADLCAIIPSLKLKMGRDCITDANLARLTDTAHFVAELCNVSPDPQQAYVGRNAFAHKGGLHVSGIAADPRTFEHVPPAAVGNVPHILVSELSGKGTVRRRLEDLGIQADSGDEVVERLLQRLKQKEHDGYHYEAADASFELLLLAELGRGVEFFRLESFRIIVEKRADGAVMTEATIKVHVDGERVIQTAEGNGPVNALDKALRLAIQRKFPQLGDIHLVNFKVRILDEAKGSGAVTRVLIDSSDGQDSWGSVGVSENLVEASWQALVDSVNYGLRRPRAVD